MLVPAHSPGVSPQKSGLVGSSERGHPETGFCLPMPREARSLLSQEGGVAWLLLHEASRAGGRTVGSDVHFCRLCLTLDARPSWPGCLASEPQLSHGPVGRDRTCVGLGEGEGQ